MNLLIILFSDNKLPTMLPYDKIWTKTELHAPQLHAPQPKPASIIFVVVAIYKNTKKNNTR